MLLAISHLQSKSFIFHFITIRNFNIQRNTITTKIQTSYITTRTHFSIALLFTLIDENKTLLIDDEVTTLLSHKQSTTLPMSIHLAIMIIVVPESNVMSANFVGAVRSLNASEIRDNDVCLVDK